MSRAAVQPTPLPWPKAALLAIIAVASFHIAYQVPSLAILIIVFQAALFALAALRTGRQAFYLGLAIGLAIYVPQLSFFWTLFKQGAIPLWIILSCWLAFFVVLGRLCWFRFGFLGWACVAPFVWLGLEYFRSELYYFKFSWLTVGYAFSQTPLLPYFSAFGLYGTGFVLMCLVSAAAAFRHVNNTWRAAIAVALALIFSFPLLARGTKSPGAKIHVAGLQYEFAVPAEIRLGLDDSIKKDPQAEIFVLSEYSFMGPPPPLITKWCQLHRKYVVAGGEDPQPNGNYYNVADVIGPDGSVVFQQAKCVPVQLMRDGLPARGQQVWESPWGKIGFCICYDASYTRVTDTLIREGAQALIVPTMDTTEWGGRQHKLHGRVGPMRSAEYGVPMFRLCSSGISQLINKSGVVTATAPYPGQGALITGDLNLIDSTGRIPPDRYLGPAAAVFTAVLAAFLAFTHFHTVK